MQFAKECQHVETTMLHTVTLSLPSRGSQCIYSSVLTCCHCFLCVLQEVVRQKVRRQLTKQQKAAQRRRLQKGEANLVTKSMRDNQDIIKSSVESDAFWG